LERIKLLNYPAECDSALSINAEEGKIIAISCNARENYADTNVRRIGSSATVRAVTLLQRQAGKRFHIFNQCEGEGASPGFGTYTQFPSAGP
jgi:hypothetical protein